MLKMADLKKDNTRNLLADIQLFAGLTPAQLDWVAQRAHRRAFPAGTNVMTIEQPGEVGGSAGEMEAFGIAAPHGW